METLCEFWSAGLEATGHRSQGPLSYEEALSESQKFESPLSA